MRTGRGLGLALVIATCVGSLSAEDWPQFLGPNRDGRYLGPPLNLAWAGDGPDVVWRRSVGEGFAGPVVTEGRVLLFHRVRDREVLEALDAETGRELWRYDYETSYRDDFGFDEGPRSVPVVDGGRVFTYGAQGQLHAVSVADGEPIWQVDAKEQFGFRKGFFGAAGSPLVDDGRVIANVGADDAGVVAFDAATGEVEWTATSDEASYSSAVAATFDGVRHAVLFTRHGLVGVESATGDVRFRERWRSRLGASVNAATPLVVEDLIFLSSSYNTGAVVFQVDGDDLDRVWSSDDALSSHYASVVHHNGYLYGFHGRQEYGPSLRAIELRTGDVAWSVDEFRAGSITLAGDHLVIVRETGELVVAPASPDEFNPIARAQVLDPVVRAYPAFANGLLYLRNEDTLVCLDLRP